MDIHRPEEALSEEEVIRDLESLCSNWKIYNRQSKPIQLMRLNLEAALTKKSV